MLFLVSPTESKVLVVVVVAVDISWTQCPLVLILTSARASCSMSSIYLLQQILLSFGRKVSNLTCRLFHLLPSLLGVSLDAAWRCFKVLQLLSHLLDMYLCSLDKFFQFLLVLHSYHISVPVFCVYQQTGFGAGREVTGVTIQIQLCV